MADKKLVIFPILLVFLFVHAACSQDTNEQLFDAVVKNDSKMVAEMLRKKADPNKVAEINGKGTMIKTSLLIMATNFRNVGIVRQLVEAKADVNLKDSFNTTALMYSVSASDVEITKVLLENGADIDLHDQFGNSAISVALDSKSTKIVQLIKDALSADERSPDSLVKRGDIAVVDDKDFAKAVSYYSKALLFDAKSKEIIAKRGRAYYALMNFEKSVTDLTFAIDNKAENLSGLYLLRGISRSMDKIHDRPGACSDLRQAESLGQNLKQDAEFYNWFKEYCPLVKLVPKNRF